MNWYIIFKTMNDKIRGTAIPQVDTLWSAETPYNKMMSQYFHNPAPDNLKVPDVKLKFRAKLTDLIVANNANSPLHTIISEYFFQILLNFQSPRTQNFKMAVIDKKNVPHPYRFFMQNSPQYNLADYSKSIFPRMLEIEYAKYLYEDFQANNYHDVIAQKGIGARALYLQENIEWDFFVLAGPPFLWMANQKVADALLEAKITGICLIPFHQGENFIDEDIVSKALRTEGTL